MSARTAGRREQTKQANRAAILEAAREVFADIGFGAASVRDIVRGTDLASGTFYNYFPDKRSVLVALLEESAGEARLRVRAARRSGTTLDAFVRDGFRAYFDFLLEDPATSQLLARNAGTIRAMYQEPSLVAGTEELAEDLAAGVAAGLIPPHDVEYMAAAMVGAALEIGARMLDSDRPDPRRATEFVSALFIAGLSAAGA
ncbi:TetR/AcrR family transcriptional regulator [Baekduia soli]|uniref:TetR/AcrR family transcriptional regulator n=1 Tax=Baekduia soli TaxID=496014 RepID=A0A5B8UAB0_9ACTN|nr:TetR/AcrR family transcriptional regulator [Baekduia soli]QEC49990.1 TetR/AcrR family transcriptional regulator [Baekduia soli]